MFKWSEMEKTPYISTQGKAGMKALTPLQKEYLEVASIFHWATRDHFVIWFTGEPGRHKRTERVLPALVKKGKLGAIRFGRKLIYAIPEFVKIQPPFGTFPIHPVHGLGCTEGLVRMIRSRNDCEIVPERFFRKAKLGSVPEWGVLYPEGKMLLYEFSTESNFYLRGNIKRKITRYRKSLSKINDLFIAESIVLFVLDVPRWDIKQFIEQIKPVGESFFFTDYQNFKEVPLGEQTRAPIYIWGEDGNYYSLKGDENVGLEIA